MYSDNATQKRGPLTRSEREANGGVVRSNIFYLANTLSRLLDGNGIEIV
jgi:hypothetical protein